MLTMFEEHYKDGSFAGEESRKRRLIGVRIGIFLAITLIGLLVAGYMKWSKSALHEKLMIRRGEATAYYDRQFYMNGTSTNPTYSIGYSYTVNGKRYHDYATFKTTPTSPEGVVFYDPDDPEQNELQPF